VRTRGLNVYFAGACLLRGADAAAIIGVALAARSAGAGDATGLLAACITLPQGVSIADRSPVQQNGPTYVTRGRSAGVLG
jgi:hypothetical protein